MATNGSFLTNEIMNVCLEFTWTLTSQDQEANTSTISWSLVGAGKGQAIYGQNFIVKIDDQVVFSKPRSEGQIKVYQGKNVASGTYTIKHNDDGSKKFKAYVEAGLYYWEANSFGNAEFTLPQIARASAIDYAADTVLGTSCDVRWKPASASFKYKLEFNVNGWSKTTDFIEPGTTDLYAYTDFVIPLNAANVITDKVTDEMTVLLFTYDSNGKQIGTESTATIDVTVPDSLKPKITINSIESDTDVFIQGKSRANVNYSTDPQYKATISSTTITVDGKPFDEVITNYGDIVVSITAVDSRGLSTTVTETIYVYPYAPPRIVPADNQVKVICSRWDGQDFSDTGELLKFIAKAEFSDVGKNNAVSFWMRWKTSSGEFSDEISLTSTDGACEAVSSVTFSKNNSYIVELGVTDTVGESTSMIFTILSEKVYWHRGAEFLALGMRENFGGFESAWEATFHNGLYIVENGVRYSLAQYITKVNGG